MKTPLIVIGSVIAVLILGGVGLYLLNRPGASPIIMQEKTYNMEKLLSSVKSKFPTVTVTKVYTEDTDPNGYLGKTGYYIQGGAFVDNRVEGTEGDTANSKDWGAEAGGSIEVYRTSADAEKRVKYLDSFQGTLLGGDLNKQNGNVVVRASGGLDRSDQEEIVNYMISLTS